MKILSLNLHCFKEDNRINKLNIIANFIKDNDIDICLFQEAAQEINNHIIIDNIKDGNNAYHIAKILNYNIVFHPIKIGFVTLEEGLAVISKHPITDIKYDTISNTHEFSTWHKRDYLKVNINNYTFYNVHLGWDIAGEVGMEQIKRLLNATTKEKNKLFICGDFNYSDDSNEINYIKKYYCSISDLANINSLNNPTFHFSLDNTTQKYNQMIDLKALMGDTSDNIIPTIEGSVYGGSAFGSVNGTTNSTNVSSNGVNIVVNEGTIDAVIESVTKNEIVTKIIDNNIHFRNNYITVIIKNYRNNADLKIKNIIEKIMSKYGNYQVFQRKHQRFQADKPENRNYTTNNTTEYIHVLTK